MGLDIEAAGLGALSGVFTFLTTLTMLLRFFARYRQKARIGLDDYCIVGAWMGFIGLVALSFYGIANGFMGYRLPRGTAVQHQSSYVMFARTYLIVDGISAVAFGMPKASAVFFYRRIFCHGAPRDVFHYVTIGCASLSLAWTITFIVLPFNLCGPLKSISYQLEHATSCQIYPYFVAVSVSDFILDLMVVVLPIPKIWSLKVTTSRKIAISAVFLIALVGLGGSTARLVIFLRMVFRGRAENDLDTYQTNTRIIYYAIFESGFNILAVNGPSLWYFMAKISVDSVLHSVRSVLSLDSRRSSKSNASDKDGLSDKAADNILHSKLSRAGQGKGSIWSDVTVEMQDLPAAERGQGGIRVERQYQREVELVGGGAAAPS